MKILPLPPGLPLPYGITRPLILALLLAIAAGATDSADTPTDGPNSAEVSVPKETQAAVVRTHSSRLSLSMPIPGFRIDRAEGTGVCIDPPGQRCRHFVTNYHVAFAASAPRVEGFEARVLTATGPYDEHATLIPVEGKKLRYDPAKDLAFLESKPLPARFHGVHFARYIPQVGQEVVVIAHHGRPFDVSRGKILAIDAAWGDGLAMRNLVIDVRVRPGNSGGVIADAQGNFLGLVAFMGTLSAGGTTRSVTIGLRTAAIYDALRALSPEMWSTIFAGYVPPAEEPTQEADAAYVGLPLTANLQVASAEAMVAALRDKTRSLLQQMLNLVARQCWSQWKNRPPVCYEVMLGDAGHAVLREIRSDKTLGAPSEQLPLPSEYGVWPYNEWASELVQTLEQPLQYEGRTESGHHVFRYHSRQCTLDEYYLWDRLPSGEPKHATGYADCSGYVVSDSDLNIEIITGDARGNDRLLTEDYVTVSTYTRVELEGGESVLAPHALRLSCKFRNHRKMFNAKVEWDQYRKFRAEHRISP